MSHPHRNSLSHAHLLGPQRFHGILKVPMVASHLRVERPPPQSPIAIPIPIVPIPHYNHSNSRCPIPAEWAHFGDTPLILPVPFFFWARAPEARAPRSDF